MACCAFDETVDEQFTNDKASQEMDRYRRKGVGPTTRRLLDGLARAGLVESSVLDVGAGIGSLTFELLDRGCRHATIVEASAAYARAASEEAARRGRATDVDFIRGDFLDVVPAALFAGIVALDRVVCCYPLYEPLLGAALRCAEHGVAISYPKDRWYTRAVIGFENARRRRRNKRFRTFVHPEADMRKVIEGAGFELVFRRTTLMWSADVYRRRGSRVANSRRPVLS
jgi:magnesium-protoporphyrin O-methyltransferase